MTYLRMSDPTVERIVHAAYPGFNGKEVKADISETVRFHSTMWDSGYRRQYRIVELATMKVADIGTAPFLRHDALYEIEHKLPDGYVVVCFVNSGMRESVEIIGNANIVTPALPAPIELTTAEKIVLSATKSYKSSYAGIKNYRFHEAKRSTGIKLEDWEAAKKSLIEKKLLNAAGAVTVEGKNVKVGYLENLVLEEKCNS